MCKIVDEEIIKYYVHSENKRIKIYEESKGIIRLMEWALID